MSKIATSSSMYCKHEAYFPVFTAVACSQCIMNVAKLGECCSVLADNDHPVPALDGKSRRHIATELAYTLAVTRYVPLSIHYTSSARTELGLQIGAAISVLRPEDKPAVTLYFTGRPSRSTTSSRRSMTRELAPQASTSTAVLGAASPATKTTLDKSSRRLLKRRAKGLTAKTTYVTRIRQHHSS